MPYFAHLHRLGLFEDLMDRIRENTDTVQVLVKAKFKSETLYRHGRVLQRLSQDYVVAGFTLQMLKYYVQMM